MELSAQKREIFGRQVKALRNEGLIPAELYGHGIENLHLAVSQKDFLKVFKQVGENTVINLVFENDRRPVLIYDVKTDPITDEVLNIDFYQVHLDKKIEVKIPVAFVGESAGVKSGGILVKAMQEVEVEALPTNIPQALEADLTRLSEIGQSIYVKDLRIPADVRLLVDPETVVATLTEPISEEEEAKMVEEVDVSEIKVEGEEEKAAEVTEE